VAILIFSILLFLAVVVAAFGMFVHGRGEGARAMAQRLSTIGRKSARRLVEARGRARHALQRHSVVDTRCGSSTSRSGSS
jgi:hypothetical protein